MSAVKMKSDLWKEINDFHFIKKKQAYKVIQVTLPYKI